MRVGLLGGGQLARMLILAGIPLGLRFRVVDPAADPLIVPGAELLRADYADPAALTWLADGSDVVSFDFENVPAQAAQRLAERVPVRPGAAALAHAQDRLREKELLQGLGIPVAPFHPVATRADLLHAIETIGLPLVLKTRRGGYDGKGQWVLRRSGDAVRAWEELGGRAAIAEAFVPFRRELSLVAARGLQRELCFYPLAENEHRGGILHRSDCTWADSRQGVAEDYVERLLSALDYVGVLALEFFDTDQGLLANEFAPRVHNSGHWSIEVCATSQFENHLRAICGLPLGSPCPRVHGGMLNFVGAVPARDALFALPGAHVHLYGKAPRPGRKLGHVTLTAGHAEELRAALRRAEGLLQRSPRAQHGGLARPGATMHGAH